MLDRRQLIAGLLGVPLAGLAGCSSNKITCDGTLRHTNFALGHRIRDGIQAQPDTRAQVDVVIVGGGIAGLSAAWRLAESGIDNFVVLELESAPGGTARGERQKSFAYPWGAHYINTPMSSNRDLIELLTQMGVAESLAADGSPVIGEPFLCREPEQRLLIGDRWYEGGYPYEIADDDDLRQLDQFRTEIDRWAAARDPNGRRMFAIPTAHGSDDHEVRKLDQISMAAWLDQHHWDSAPLRWLVDYACRDDYGLSPEQTSAWAGIFYFASRIQNAGDDPQGVITWPEGNGRIVDFLAERIGDRIRCGWGVMRITGGTPVETTALDTKSDQVTEFRSRHAIFCAPQFVADRVIVDRPIELAKPFRYGSWLVANLHLAERPAVASFPVGRGLPMAWDNVIHNSRSLGYVTSTHQSGRDHGPTVLTWYHPFADDDPRRIREQMLKFTWSDWAEFVLSDMRIAHPDIDRLVSRIDIQCWGHAMVRPYPGFVFHQSRMRAAVPQDQIHFANTDLSAIALCEEAFYHGVRAADEVVSSLA